MSVFSRLRGSGYLRLVAAQAGSAGSEFFIESLTKVSLAVVLPGGGAVVGLAASNAANSLPRLVLPPLAGRMADFSDRALLLRASILARAVIAVLLLGFTIAAGETSTAFAVAIVAVSLLTVSAAQCFNVARQSYAQAIIPPEARPDAASLSMFALTGIAVIASALAPGLYGVIGASGVIVLAVALELLALAILRPARDPAGRRGVRLRERGARAAAGPAGGSRRLAARTRSVPGVRLVFGIAGTYAVCTGAVNLVLPLYALRTRELAIWEYGVVTGAFAAGGILGALATARIVHRLGAARSLAMSAGLAALGYVAFAAVPSLWPMALAMVFIGACVSVLGASQGPLLQELVPNAVMGRIFGRLTVVNTAWMIVGTGLGVLLVLGVPTATAATAEGMYVATIAAAAAVLLLGTALAALAHRRAGSAEDGGAPARR